MYTVIAGYGVMDWSYEYCFTSLSAQSWQYRDGRKHEAGTMPYSYFEWLQGFFIVHSTIGSTVHPMPLNSLVHCICTTTMTNIRPDRDSNLVPPGYKPQSIRMSHRGRRWTSTADVVTSSKHDTFTQCWVTVSPPSTTSAQHLTNIGLWGLQGCAKMSWSRHTRDAVCIPRKHKSLWFFAWSASPLFNGDLQLTRTV